MSKFQNPDELQAAYPYLFAGSNIGLEIYTGWFPGFAQLCTDIDALLGADKRGFHWVQLKEKFGAARWYWDLKNEPGPLAIDIQTPTGVVSILRNEQPPSLIAQQLADLIGAAQSATKRLCVVCGAPGANDQHDGYYLVVCPEHARMRREQTQEWITYWHQHVYMAFRSRGGS